MKILDYDLEPGHNFHRLIAVKDKRTHRSRPVATAQAVMRYAGPGSAVMAIATEVNSSKEIEILIDYETTLLLSTGLWEFDVVANWRGDDEPVARGTINVLPLTVDITPPFSAPYSHSGPPPTGTDVITIERGASWTDTVIKYADADKVDTAAWEDGTYTAFIVSGDTSGSNVLATLDVDDTQASDGVLTLSVATADIPMYAAYGRIVLVRSHLGEEYDYLSIPPYVVFS